MIDGAEANLIVDAISILAVAAFLGATVVSIVSGVSVDTAFLRGAMAFAVIGALGWLTLRVVVSGVPRAEAPDANEEGD